MAVVVMGHFHSLYYRETLVFHIPKRDLFANVINNLVSLLSIAGLF